MYGNTFKDRWEMNRNLMSVVAECDKIRRSRRCAVWGYTPSKRAPRLR
jgi:hypothetical protein